MPNRGGSPCRRAEDGATPQLTRTFERMNRDHICRATQARRGSGLGVAVARLARAQRSRQRRFDPLSARADILGVVLRLQLWLRALDETNASRDPFHTTSLRNFRVARPTAAPDLRRVMEDGQPLQLHVDLRGRRAIPMRSIAVVRISRWPAACWRPARPLAPSASSSSAARTGGRRRSSRPSRRRR